MKSPIVEISPDEEAKIDANIKAESLEKQLNKRYNEEFVKLLKRLAYEISVVGLPLNEACMYVGIDPEKLKMVMTQDNLVSRLIETKDLEYKRGLLLSVSEKAKNDDRMSQWLLERRYPEEFSTKRVANPGGSGDADLLGMAVEFIQKSGDNNPLVSEKTGKITVVKRTSAENRDFMKKIESILK